jgi:inositol oxygenase
MVEVVSAMSPQESRPESTQSFRDYDHAKDTVKQLYREQRTHQCKCHVERCLSKYDPGSPGCEKKLKMSVWEALMALGSLVDASDPDVTVPNLQHAFQTAEGIRADGLPEWMQLCALIHDLGKVLYLKGCDEDGTSVNRQFSVVGDTFVVDYPRSPSLIYPEYNHLCCCDCEKLEERRDDPSSSTLPMSFDDCLFSFGHDEYLYRVLVHNSRRTECSLNLDVAPDELPYIVRYHSFHAWSEFGGYQELAGDRDREFLPTLIKFCRYDLYTKSDTEELDGNALKEYYDGLMKKTLGCGLDEKLEW